MKIIRCINESKYTIEFRLDIPRKKDRRYKIDPGEGGPDGVAFRYKNSSIKDKIPKINELKLKIFRRGKDWVLSYYQQIEFKKSENLVEVIYRIKADGNLEVTTVHESKKSF